MAIEHARHDMSYDDYAAIDDGERYELIEGELVPMGPAPYIRHQRVAGLLFVRLVLHMEATRQGEAFIAPMDVVLRTERRGTTLQPDVAVVLAKHRARVTQANIQGPPDLVVEVLSPSNARKDAVRKRLVYERFGVPEYWIVPEHTDRVEILRLGPDGRYDKPLIFEPGERLTTPLLPGFVLEVAAVFPPEPADG